MKKKVFLFLLVVLALSWVVYEGKYYLSYWLDTYQRPWAYSRDPNTKLLVGQWEGAFTDPNGILKHIELEVFEPITKQEREQKASRFRHHRRGLGSYKSKQTFDGVAVVKSKLGTEEYEIYGSVDKDDFHRFRFNFRPANEAKRILPNFTLLEAQDGSWQDDQLSVRLGFSYHNADGSSSYRSKGIVKNGKIEWQSSKDDAKVSVSLRRQGAN